MVACQGDGEVEIFLEEVEKMEVCGSWWKIGGSCGLWRKEGI